MQAVESKALVAVSAAGLAFAGYHLTASTMVPESRLVHAKSGTAPPSYDEEGAARNKQRLVRRRQMALSRWRVWQVSWAAF